MRIEELNRYKNQIYQIAARHHITKVYVFGSVARGETNETSDIDFLIEMEDEASALGVGGFQFEVQQLLGIDRIDVIPTYILSMIDDRKFAINVQAEAVAL